MKDEIMNCRQCDKEITDEKWKHCPHCGESLTDEKIIRFLFGTLFRGKNRYLIVLVFLILLVSSFGIFFKSQSEIDKKNEKIEEFLNKEKEISIDWEVKPKVLPITYFDSDYSLIELDVSSPVFATLEVKYSVDGLTEVEKKVIKIKPESKRYYLKPKLKEMGIVKLEDSQRANVKLEIFLTKSDSQKEEILKDNKETFFYSINDIIWLENGVGNENEIVRWIDKDSTEIKELVRKAADHVKELGGAKNAMVGGLGDRAEVERQMKAIFLAMKDDLEIRYVLAPFSYDGNVVQKIKDPIEVVKTKSGLCIELAMLMAAALENVGLNPVLVIISGHAWAGVEIGPKTNDFIFIETTALGVDPSEAIRIGMENWEQRTDYRLLRVSDLRHDGYLPLAYYYH